MAFVIEKENERHPSHPVYKKHHANVAASEKPVKVAEEKSEKPVKVPERKNEKSE